MQRSTRGDGRNAQKGMREEYLAEMLPTGVGDCKVKSYAERGDKYNERGMVGGWE